MMTCPHCPHVRVRADQESTADVCCVCHGTLRIATTWLLVWAWDYRGCSCLACRGLREMRPFSLKGLLPVRPEIARESPADLEPRKCECGRLFVPWPEDLKPNRGPKFRLACGPCQAQLYLENQRLVDAEKRARKATTHRLRRAS